MFGVITFASCFSRGCPGVLNKPRLCFGFVLKSLVIHHGHGFPICGQLMS